MEIMRIPPSEHFKYNMHYFMWYHVKKTTSNAKEKKKKNETQKKERGRLVNYLRVSPPRRWKVFEHGNDAGSPARDDGDGDGGGGGGDGGDGLRFAFGGCRRRVPRAPRLFRRSSAFLVNRWEMTKGWR